jgi:imidazolonepropionase
MRSIKGVIMQGKMLFQNIGELMSLKGVVKKAGCKIKKKDLGLIRDAVLVTNKGQVEWIGPKSRLPPKYLSYKKVDLNGQNLFPGFIDCHTHSIFAGDRKNEFEMRHQGWTYQQIARQGGGILSTMKATRKASVNHLIELGQKRMNQFLSQGVTTVEIKSGYGLTTKSEMKMLEAAKNLKGPYIVTTYLGAHAIPQEYKGEADYLESLLKDLRTIKDKKLSQRVDIFIEKGYFTKENSKPFLQKAKDMGFDLTIHADQLNRTGATSLAIDLGAISADHVICLNKKDQTKLAQSETVGVLLPAADFYLDCDYPDARSLIDQGACVALATDFNPGSSPTQSLSLVGVLARLKMKMTLPEVFAALTYGGAKALGLQESKGALVKGYDADFFVTDQSWDEFFYDMSEIRVKKVYRNAKALNY